MISLAGPLMNFVIAIISCVAYLLIVGLAESFVSTSIGSMVLYWLSILVSVNIGLWILSGNGRKNE